MGPALRQRITSRTRAIALVHPNNPTGHFTRPPERAAIEELCREHGLALIVDEVFLDYQIGGGGGVQSFASGPHPVPTFVLDALSENSSCASLRASTFADLSGGAS